MKRFALPGFLLVTSITLCAADGPATAPPIMIGLWQVRSAGRVGRSLLASQLDQQLDELAWAVRARWSYRKGNLLLLAVVLWQAHLLRARRDVALRDLDRSAGVVREPHVRGRSRVRARRQLCAKHRHAGEEELDDGMGPVVSIGMEPLLGQSICGHLEQLQQRHVHRQ